jgi:hypothetical protein
MLTDLLIIICTVVMAEVLWTKYVDPWLDKRGW